ncbi:MAG: toluene transporter subunit: rane component of superfamily, partial [Pseudomonadota bacterium]
MPVARAPGRRNKRPGSGLIPPRFGCGSTVESTSPKYLDSARDKSDTGRVGAANQGVAGARAVPQAWFVSLLGHLGRSATGAVGGLGEAALFFSAACGRIPTRPWRFKLVLEQLHFIGNRSILIIVLTGAFTGLVLTLQGYNTLDRFGAEQWVGRLVALSLTKELAPVLGALMVTARAGSAIAATLGNMRVTEQIDALKTLAIDPLHYLVAPRLLAGILVGPLLTSMFTLVGLGVSLAF